MPIERHLRLAPTPGNPRNSEGDFARLADGRWLYVYTHFIGGAADHAAAFLASRVSTDAGRTWSTNDAVVVANEGAFNVMSVSLLRLKSGGIALFYLRKNSLQDCRPVMRLSKDEGATWSAPTDCITNDLGYYVLNNSRVIQREGGRLVMPLAYHGANGKKLEPGQVVVLLSDDEGKSWRRSGSVLSEDSAGARQNFMEPGVVELEGDHLLMVIRTKLGCQYFSESSDGGKIWSAPRPSSLLSPEAPATIVRIPGTTNLLAVWNDQYNQTEAYRRSQPPRRTPLAIAISRDAGRTWDNHHVIEDQPGHGYCYTAVAFAGDRVLLAYCAHASRYGLETTLVSSFPLSAIEP
jgi:Neuraminidase (sialidase)